MCSIKVRYKKGVKKFLFLFKESSYLRLTRNVQHLKRSSTINLKGGFNMASATSFRYWLPRVAAIIYIVFISIFALDAFSKDFSLFENIIAFVIHLIPSFILLALTIIAWKWQKLGGLLLIVASIIFTFFFKSYREFWGFVIITIPILLLGLLFIILRPSQKNKTG